MPSRMPQQFDVFAQLVATGSIVGCARALDLTPASVIESVNALEDRMGFQLFVATEGRMDLTEAGRKMVDALGQMALEETSLPTKESAPAAATAVTAAPAQPTGGAGAISPPNDEERPLPPRHFHPQNPGTMARQEETPAARPEPDQTIVLASHPAIFSHFQEALVAFEQASPDIRIALRLESIDEAGAAHLFDHGLADIAYYYALGEPEHFTSRYAWSERISLFVGEGNALADRDAVAADDLAALDYAALASGNIARVLTERALAEGGLTLGPPVLETDDLYRLMRFIEENHAYCAAFGPTARDVGRMGGIRRLSYAQGLPQIQVRQAVRADRIDDPAVLALSEFLFR